MRAFTIVLVGLLATASGIGVAGQDKPAQTSPPAAVTVIKAARLVDVATGLVLRNQAVVVEGNLIKAVTLASAPAPSGATVIDLGDATLMPGLMDCHTQAGIPGGRPDGVRV